MGLRQPDCRPLLEILNLTGPVYATSANFSGELPPFCPEMLTGGLVESCDYYFDIDFPMSGKPSAVIDISGIKKKVLRA